MSSADLDSTDIRAHFRHSFCMDPTVVARAPGRVALIGGHVDYNDGFIIGAAIDRELLAAGARATDSLIQILSLNYGQMTEFEVSDIRPDEGDAKWSNYARGVISKLIEAGHRVRGMRLLVRGSLPQGGGLSSSAAIELAVCIATLALADQEMPPIEMARLCQRAENEFVGVRSGIMDQFVSLHGRAGMGVFLDCRSLEHEIVPLPTSTRIVVCDSKRPRSLSSSDYNSRRGECEEAVRLLKQWIPRVTHLRDVSSEDLVRFQDRMPERIARRAEHVVEENARVLAAATALKEGDSSEFGRLLNDSHSSSRDLFESSVPELDILQEAAMSVRGCLGSRLTGAGFGGCTVSLVEEPQVPEFTRSVSHEYSGRTGLRPDVLVLRASDGAGIEHDV